MKRDNIIVWLFVLLLVLAFSGIAVAGEGNPACGVLPSPTSGQFLVGTFTAARDKSYCTGLNLTLCGHYNFHVFLAHGRKQHLFSTPVTLEDLTLCTYVASNPNGDNGLKELGAKIPCLLGVGEAFGLTGVPVIYDLKIVETDFCGTDDEMMLGFITIRVVP